MNIPSYDEQVFRKANIAYISVKVYIIRVNYLLKKKKIRESALLKENLITMNLHVRKLTKPHIEVLRLQL